MLEGGNTPGTTRSRTRLVPALGLLVLMLTGCGGDGVTLPTPTGSGLTTTPSVSVSVSSGSSPSRSGPSGSVAPSIVVPESPTPEPTQTQTQTQTQTPAQEPSTTPAPTRAPAPTTSVIVTATATATATPSATASAAAETVDDEGGGFPAWLWWALAALLAGLAAFLGVRARRGSDWDAELAAAKEEVSWFARELLPQLQQARTPDALAGGWQVSAARVGAVEDQLTGLEASAPDETRGARARTLRDAVRASRADVEALIDSGDQASAPAQLAASSSRLLDALDSDAQPD